MSNLNKTVEAVFDVFMAELKSRGEITGATQSLGSHWLRREGVKPEMALAITADITDQAVDKWLKTPIVVP